MRVLSTLFVLAALAACSEVRSPVKTATILPGTDSLVRGVADDGSVVFVDPIDGYVSEVVPGRFTADEPQFAVSEHQWGYSNGGSLAADRCQVQVPAVSEILPPRFLPPGGYEDGVGR